MATKLTVIRIAALVQATELGATRALAAKYAGISRGCLQKWIKKGREDEAPEFVELVERLEQAEGIAAVKWLAAIEKTSKVTWQAAAWKLERLYPHMYGKAESRGIPKRAPESQASTLAGFEKMTTNEQRDALRSSLEWGTA